MRGGRWWLWVAAALAVLKLALLRAQPIYAIGGAAHDDLLFLRLARFIAEGQWLGPYDNLTLAKGAVYPAFVAANYYLGLPLRFIEQLIYVGACALAVRALFPLVRASWARLLIFAALLWNPLTWEGEHMTRILRQHLTVPLALTVAASLIALTLRHDRSFRARLPWALLAGLALGLFWNTREEGIWIAPMAGLLAAGAFFPLVAGPATARLPALGLLVAGALIACVPTLTISTLNHRHYGWFGTNEFHAAEFKAAYGALARVQVGPVRPKVVVSREAREAIYAVSPAFAELRPHLEGEIGLRWANAEDFRREERQIGSGWFMWALRDAVAAAGHTRSAADAIAYYDRLAREVNAACDDGRLPALSRRDGYFPRWQPAYTEAVRTGAPAYVAAMLDFSRFDTNAPLSVGTDDDVRIFRDITHERISPSVNATHIELPLQRALNARKLTFLRELGQTLGGWLRVALILAHLAAAVRLVQVIRARRLPTAFGLSVAVWCGGAAALALNLLAHTTSMPNFYPAAYSPSFPLLILFVLLVAIDVGTAWRDAAARAWKRARELLNRHPVTAWSLGIGLIVFGARLREIALHGGEVPLFEAWRVQAAGILTPWLQGNLDLAAFFAPDQGQVPLWSRLMGWAQAAIFGSWDSRGQMIGQAALHSAWAGLLAGGARRYLPSLPALFAGVVILALSALPHAWESVAGGFAAQNALALLCLLAFVHGSFAHATGSRSWWIAQVVGVAGLFALGNFWTAPLVLAAVTIWTAPRTWRRTLAPLGLAALGAAMWAWASRAGSPEAAATTPPTAWRDFLQGWFLLLGWPVAVPGAGALVQLPLLVFALRLRGAEQASACDRTLLTLGLWSAGVAAWLALAGSGSELHFLSRHADLLALGVIVNGLILLRLAASAKRWWLPALAWTVVVTLGLYEINTRGPAFESRARSGEHTAFRRAAISDAVMRRDDAQLASLPGRELIYPDPATVRRQLDDPRFAALLPSSLRGGPFTAPALPSAWLIFLAVGLVLAAASSRRDTARGIAPVATGAPLVAPWAVVVMLAAGLTLLWPRPLAWDAKERWENLVYPPTPLRELPFEFATSTKFPADRLWGAALLMPEALRNLFIGTHVDGPTFTGIVRSRSFTIDSPALVLPFAGYPTAPGNSLSLIIEGAEAGAPLATLTCTEPDPRTIGFWGIDVTAYRGRTAHFELRDGRAGDAGWLAVAAPQPAPQATLAATKADAWEAERSLSGRRTGVALLGLSLLGLAVATITRRR